MDHLILLGFKRRRASTFLIFLLVFLSFSNCFAQVSNERDICQNLAIESAQLANQSFSYAQKSYFDPPSAEESVDTALIFIREAISLIDSAIALASDSSLLGIEYAAIAKEYAIDSYHNLIDYKDSQNDRQKNELSKKAMTNSENATVEAYKASFYLKAGKKTSPAPAPAHEKQITKLDIDQTLFTLLKEELQQKKETNTQEISKLLEDLSKTNEPVKQSKLKVQIKELELKGKELDKKTEDARQKLTSINVRIEERSKNEPMNLGNEETVFSKSITKTTDEWNKQVKLDEELPNGLVYQVQLGVYKNTILPEIFKGLTPIYGKTTDNGVSYSTGLFEKLTDAKEAKNYLLSIGFADAFIVAYKDKNKIPLNEAIKLEK